MEYLEALRKAAEDWATDSQGAPEGRFFDGMVAAMRLLAGDSDWVNERPHSNHAHPSWAASVVHYRALELAEGRTPRPIGRQ